MNGRIRSGLIARLSGLCMLKFKWNRAEIAGPLQRCGRRCGALSTEDEPSGDRCSQPIVRVGGGKAALGGAQKLMPRLTDSTLVLGDRRSQTRVLTRLANTASVSW